MRKLIVLTCAALAALIAVTLATADPVHRGVAALDEPCSMDPFDPCWTEKDGLSDDPDPTEPPTVEVREKGTTPYDSRVVLDDNGKRYWCWVTRHDLGRDWKCWDNEELAGLPAWSRFYRHDEPKQPATIRVHAPTAKTATHYRWLEMSSTPTKQELLDALHEYETVTYPSPVVMGSCNDASDCAEAIEDACDVQDKTCTEVTFSLGADSPCTGKCSDGTPVDVICT